VRCRACGSENPEGKRYCRSCGASLAGACATCGSQLKPDDRFCGDCGGEVLDAAGAKSPSAGASQNLAHLQAGVLSTELRHVSVLFCDLVGFTPFSEKRDPEEVREVLSGYFELARAIVGRYGGVVQKFIGDAVMAVWGAPVAKEDDAERAVRAGLELVSAVAAYGSEHGTDLQARVGIVTGEAATTETAEEGLVIGDRVNTAARIQSAALPGCCYVEETTRAATAAAIAYADAGEHTLKGKAEPVRLFQATRVVATVAGAQRAGVIEAPFIGRDRELHLVKELFHASAERHSTRMVLVSGVAGVGKSRLAWEFAKYIDGVAGEVLWHAGRCLSYGEGVSYWALSEMVRSRLLIGEEDQMDLVAERLRAGLERWIADAADREFISPRLGQLLGLPTARVLAKEELFAGWRLFFERLAEHLPVVMVVEDLQWADAGLVDFLDHLLEWSGDHAIFLLVLSRPEGTERKGLSLSRRSVTALTLDPLSDETMGELLDGLVTGLPRDARARIVERADGIPLYAVETVRGLLDRGIVTKGTDGSLQLGGEIGELETPPGLTALISSRLDGLDPNERQLVRECSVLGGSFPHQAVEALSELDPAVLDDVLSSLVRKEVLTVRADRFSPDRGQYGFTQSLIRSVAYDMLTRAERKARHLRTAEHLRVAFPDEGAEVSEVIASHVHDAYKAAGDDPDAARLRAWARDAYIAAAERAESVGAPEGAEAAYTTAAELSSNDIERVQLIEKAGRMAVRAGLHPRAVECFEAAATAHQGAGRATDAARVVTWLAPPLRALGRGEFAIGLLREALASLEPGTAPPAVLASLQEALGSSLIFVGHLEEASAPIEEALLLAQHYELAETLVAALVSRSLLLHFVGRYEEARIGHEGSLAIARRLGITEMEIRAEGNLADLCMTRDIPGAEEHCRAMLALARRWGVRRSEAIAAENLIYVLTMAGRFEEAYEAATDLRPGVEGSFDASWLSCQTAILDALRGRGTAAREHLASGHGMATSDDPQDRAIYAAGESIVAVAEQNFPLGLEAALRAIEEFRRGGIPLANESIRLSFPEGIDAALALGDLDQAEQLVELLEARPPGEVPPFLQSQLGRARSLLGAARGGDEGVEEGLVGAREQFQSLNYPFWVARAQLDLAGWLAGRGRTQESAQLAARAAVSFEAIGAAPMLARARALVEPETARELGEVAMASVNEHSASGQPA
jgi:class 3 adenylate cyclase/tetratricopeptide (TPR) repeat protein